MSNLNQEVKEIAEELNHNVEVIRLMLNKAHLCIVDAQVSIDNISEDLSIDEVNSAIAFLVDAEAFIDSIGYKTPKFDTLVDTLSSVRYQITENS